MDVDNPRGRFMVGRGNFSLVAVCLTKGCN